MAQQLRQGPADSLVAQQLRRPSTERRLGRPRARTQSVGSAEDTRLEGRSGGKPPIGKPPRGKPPFGKPPRGKPPREKASPRDRKRGVAPPATPNRRLSPSQIGPEIPSYQIRQEASRARASAEPATPLSPRACLRLLDEMNVDSIVIGCRNHAAISAGKASSPLGRPRPDLGRARPCSTTEAKAPSPPRCSRPAAHLSAQNSAHLNTLTSSESKLSAADVPLESDRRPPRGPPTPLERPPPRARQQHGQYLPPRARLGAQSPRARLGARETAVGPLHSHGLEA